MTSIKELAEAAEVSIATVSRVFNNSPDVSAKTKERILALARQLNYQPSKAARNLRRRARGEKDLNYSIALALSTAQSLAEHPFIAELMAGVEKELHRHGFQLHILHIDDGASLLPAIEAGDIDAIIGHCQIPNAEDLPEDFPIILLDSFTHGQRAYSVVPDYRSGVKDLVCRLLLSGRQRIALCIGEEHKHGGHSFSEQIYDGFRDAYEICGQLLPSDLCAGAAYTPTDGYQLAKQIINNDQDIQVIISNDSAAIGVLRAAQELHKSVPNELEVHGIDGLSIGQFTIPSLSSIDVKPANIGQRAAEIVVGILKNKQTRYGMELSPTSLVQRESCKH